MPQRRGHQGKRDANHVALRDLWRKLGGSWFDTAALPGELDGVASAFGETCRVEVWSKDKRKLTPDEEKTCREWNGWIVHWKVKDDVLRTRSEMLVRAGGLDN